MNVITTSAPMSTLAGILAVYAQCEYDLMAMSFHTQHAVT